MEQINDIPLVDNGNEKMETLQSELDDMKMQQNKKKYVILGSIFAALLVAAIIVVSISASSSFSPNNSEGELPGCQNYNSFSCKGSEGDMDEQYKDNLKLLIVLEKAIKINLFLLHCLQILVVT